MSTGPVGRRYARALLELADEQNALDRVRRELSEIVRAWQSSEELRGIYDNPAFTSEMRSAVLRKLTDRMGLSTLIRNTLLLMSDRRRLRYLPELQEAFEALAEEKAGRVRAEVVTAVPLPDAYFVELQRTLEAVTGKKVLLARKEDPSLIAGVVTRIGDKVFDGSLRNQLDELKEELLPQ